MTYPTLYLLRHGQTEWNVEGRLQGRLDSALTETGMAQAHAQRAILAPILAAHPGIAIHASPLGRAWRTASVVAEGRTVQAVDGLKEVFAGTWEGRLRAEVVAERGFGSAEEKDMFSLFLSAPNGEGGRGFGGPLSRLSGQPHPAHRDHFAWRGLGLFARDHLWSALGRDRRAAPCSGRGDGALRRSGAGA